MGYPREMVAWLLLVGAMASSQDETRTHSVTDGVGTQVAPRILTLLRKSEIIIALPTSIPMGFSCNNLAVDEGDAGLDILMVWTRETDEATIMLQVAWEGIEGSTAPEGTTVSKREIQTSFGSTSLFGNTTDGYFEWGHGWLAIPGTQNGDLQAHYLLSGSGLNLEEAAKIATSVRILQLLE